MIEDDAGAALAAPRRKRDPERSKENILKAATAEFCAHGFTGARVDRIATHSGANMRMLYHYFGSKEGLYLAVLERVYGEIRKKERELDLADQEPLEGMRRLVRFTFDFFAARKDIIALINNENLMKGRFVKRSKNVHAMTMPLIEAIDDLLKRGARSGVFREAVDPLQIYVSIVAQSQIHISSRYTLSTLFDQNLESPAWIAARRRHSEELILAYLTVSTARP